MTGTIYIVGIGPGDTGLLTPEAFGILQRVDVIVGYEGYIKLLRSILKDQRQLIEGRQLSQETQRAALAIQYTRQGRDVAVVSGGDAGIYGMAGVVLEWLWQNPWSAVPPIEVVPGISAIQAAAARVGAPIMHDFAVVSLSDLLTPWPQIIRRVQYAAQGDFVLGLYNPRSARRHHQIKEAQDILLRYRDPKTPVAVVRNAYRADESVILSDIFHFLDYRIDMFSTVVVGNSQSVNWNGRFITPRGYYSRTQGISTPRILVLGGTIEGRIIAQRLASRRFSVTLSYQKPAFDTEIEGVECRWGSWDMESLKAYAIQHHVRDIVDMAHPDSRQMHDIARRVCHDLGIRYVRYQRYHEIAENSLITRVHSHEQAAVLAQAVSGTVMLFIGTKFLSAYASRLLNNPEVFPVVRTLPTSESLGKAESLGFASRQIIAMLGPYSREFNGALYDHYSAQLVIAKAGSYDLLDKVLPALERNIPVLIVDNKPLGDREGMEVREDTVYSLKDVETLLDRPFVVNTQ